MDAFVLECWVIGIHTPVPLYVDTTKMFSEIAVLIYALQSVMLERCNCSTFSLTLVLSVISISATLVGM